MSSSKEIKDQLAAFKRKYYFNKALKGVLVWSSILFASYFLINTLEFTARFNETGRAILFFSFLLGISFSAYSLFVKHLLKLSKRNKQISDEQVAREVGRFFPEVSDKLLNLLQLKELSNEENELISASIQQKESELIHVPFVNAIDLNKNKLYLKYVLPPAIAIILALIFIPQLITKSSERIIKFNRAYIPEAPFAFEINNRELLGFRNEPFLLNISTKGRSVPNEVFLQINGRRLKTKNEGNGQFTYSFNAPDGDISFVLEGASVISGVFQLKVVDRPTLNSFQIELDYPAYTQIPSESIQNSGNLNIPEGTHVKWMFKAQNTENALIKINEEAIALQKNNGAFVFDSAFTNNFDYDISLTNAFAKNKNGLQFSAKIIKDQYPKISLEQYQDTILYRDIILAGNITDDYGFSRLKLKYSYEGQDSFETEYFTIDKSLKEQTYYHVFRLDSAYIKAGGEFKYYMEVSDNDVVNGSKRSKTSTFSFRIPSREQISEQIEKGNQQVKEDIDQTLNRAQDLQNSIKELDERLKTKKELDWQDEKLMEEILEQKEELSRQLEELREENQKNNTKREQFEPKNDEIQERMRQLQEIMDNVLDDQTKRMYDELRKLLEENADIEEFREQVEEIKQNSQNLEKDLERTLELFKKLQFDMKLDQMIKDLEKEIGDQGKLQKETAEGSKSNEELADEQKRETQDLDKLKDSSEELNQLNQDRKNPTALPGDLNEALEEIQDDQKEAQKQLESSSSNDENEEESEENEQNEGKSNEEKNSSLKGQRQKAAKSQKRATQKMKEIKKSLESMQSSMGMEQAQEDLGNLRDLVDNLVTLSFNQEALMNEFKDIRQSDPRFVELSQKQLKIQDDSKIIQDSLISLSQRVFQISSFVMKELNEMNRQMNGSVESLKEKKVSQAVGKQQFTMTSINNMALLLDDIVQQMQNEMANSMGGMGQENKSGMKNMPMSSLSELQQQLSEQIKEIKNSGKNGRQLSEELAKMAAQQERIRNALENFETGLDGNKLGEKIDRLIEQMEMNEMDLLNKNISEETIERQRDILTRMLDAENALEQRGKDDKREAETAYQYELSVPESMLEYLKQKEKEIELLRTIPTKLNPYYKKETNKYFNKIKNKD